MRKKCLEFRKGLFDLNSSEFKLGIAELTEVWLELNKVVAGLSQVLFEC